jgi:hypothetical protein
MALNWLEYGARNYDARLGRWWSVDPLAGKYESVSPYVFTANNPVRYREIDGRYYDEANEKKAEKMVRRSERRAEKLERKAQRLENRNQDSGDLRDRVAELRKTARDIKDMGNDQNTEYRFEKLGSKGARANNVAGPAAMKTGENSQGHEVVTMYTEGNMGSRLHEARHGGQHARGELNIATGAGYGVADEVDAYRAQYSWGGNLRYRDNPSEAVAIHRALQGKPIYESTVTHINQITPGWVNAQYEARDANGNPIPLYPPRDVNGRLLIPLNVWNQN